MTEGKPGPALRLQRVERRVGGFRLAVELSCDSWPLVLLGPSGSGKTTLLRMLAGLDRPRGGRIEFDSKIWYDGSDPERPKSTAAPPYLRDIGYCLQEPQLFPHLSVMENVAYPLSFVRPRLKSGERRTRAT